MSYHCESCNKSFRREIHYNRHRDHSEECNICGISTCNLSLHVRECLDPHILKCNNCKHSFKNRDVLHIHIELDKCWRVGYIHKCANCDIFFPSKQECSDHFASTHIPVYLPPEPLTDTLFKPYSYQPNMDPPKRIYKNIAICGVIDFEPVEFTIVKASKSTSTNLTEQLKLNLETPTRINLRHIANDSPRSPKSTSVTKIRALKKMQPISFKPQRSKRQSIKINDCYLNNSGRLILRPSGGLPLPKIKSWQSCKI